MLLWAHVAGSRSAPLPGHRCVVSLTEAVFVIRRCACNSVPPPTSAITGGEGETVGLGALRKAPGDG